MTKSFKRKQFHLSPTEENILREASAVYHISEAEVVRMAIRKFGQEQTSSTNSLLAMAETAKRERQAMPDDLSERHDDYLAEIFKHES